MMTPIPPTITRNRNGMEMLKRSKTTISAKSIPIDGKRFIIMNPYAHLNEPFMVSLNLAL